MRYPDPDRVVYAHGGQPPPFPPQLTTQNAGRLAPIHAHCAFINKNGDGTTDVTASHFHRVVRGKIQPDGSDGHTHDLTGLPCGAG